MIPVTINKKIIVYKVLGSGYDIQDVSFCTIISAVLKILTNKNVIKQNVPVATNDLIESLATPHTICPEVHPFEYLVPIPTINPKIIIEKGIEFVIEGFTMYPTGLKKNGRKRYENKEADIIPAIKLVP